MTDSEEIIEAARQLGEALRESDAMRALAQAEAAIAADAELQAAIAEVEQLNDDLLARQEAGDWPTAGEMTWFNRMREAVNNHPLMLEREACRKAVKVQFAQAGGVLNRLLPVDFIAITLGE